MSLTEKLDNLWNWMYHIEHTDVIEANVIRPNNGSSEPLVFIDHIRVKDPKRVRMNRIKTELNDIDIPSVEDPSQGIRSVRLNYDRRITYLFGRSWKFDDVSVIEKTIEYEDGTRRILEVPY